MAGGLGKRMNSDLPKVLHKVSDKPMLVKIIDAALPINPVKILIVVGKYRPIIEDVLNQYITPLVMNTKIEFINQMESLGTGHAIQCCTNYFKNIPNTTILILSGDTPLLTTNTIQDFMTYNQHIRNKIMTTILENPYGNGRIVRDSNNNNKFMKIVEEKDCNEIEKKIEEVNCGIYMFESHILMKYITKLTNNNAQSEYYLTDVVKIIKDNDHPISIYVLPKNKQYELMNVNTHQQLEMINCVIKDRI